MLAHCWIAFASACRVDGKVGIDWSGELKLKALVRSPTVERRQALRLGTPAPKRVSRNRNTEV